MDEQDQPPPPPPPPGASSAPESGVVPPLPSPPPLPGVGDDVGGEGTEIQSTTVPAGADDAATLRERALRHQTEQTRTYPCRACGGELEFDIALQRLKCPHCGAEAEIIEDADNEVLEQDFATAVQLLHEGVIDRTNRQVVDEKEVVCQNCGGHTTFVGSLTATRCPYCATPIQRDDVHEAPTRLAVDGVLPFQVDDDAAEAAIDKWINSRWFAPNEFKKYSTTGSFASVYASYFTYDAMTTTDYRGQRGDNYTVTVGSGENRRTETRIRWRRVSGTVRDNFDDIPVLANEGFERPRIQALEPWPTQQAKPFSAEYVAGHLCRTYDHGVEECFGEAKGRVEDGVRSTVRRDIGGDHQRISAMSVRYDLLTFKHLLLPIWLLTVIYDQRPFQVFINGVTGEVQGQRPYSKIKIACAVVLAIVVIAVIAILVRNSQSSVPQ